MPTAPPGALDRRGETNADEGRAGVGLRIAVTMPITSPPIVISGPPEFPGLAAASNWISPVITCLPSCERKLTVEPGDNTGAEIDGPMPNGKPTATTSSPCCRCAVDPSVADAGRPAIFARLDDGQIVLGIGADEIDVGLGAVEELDVTCAWRR